MEKEAKKLYIRITDLRSKFTEVWKKSNDEDIYIISNNAVQYVIVSINKAFNLDNMDGISNFRRTPYKILSKIRESKDGTLTLCKNSLPCLTLMTIDAYNKKFR